MKKMKRSLSIAAVMLFTVAGMQATTASIGRPSTLTPAQQSLGTLFGPIDFSKVKLTPLTQLDLGCVPIGYFEDQYPAESPTYAVGEGPPPRQPIPTTSPAYIQYRDCMIKYGKTPKAQIWGYDSSGSIH